MSETLSGTYTSGITLTASPATITSLASVGNTAASGIAVTGPSGTAWTLTNQGTVTESGSGAGIGVSLANAGTVTNAGSISGNTTVSGGAGLYLAQGGVVTNQAGGYVGGYTGIVAAGSSTVENAGSIGGTTAVAFSAGVANRLIDDPSASFAGLVNGGNSLGSSFASTLELSSSATTGTLSGLGTQFVNFAQTTVDAGATWALLGNETVSTGGTLTNSGTLLESQITLNSASLTNQTSGLVAVTVYGPSSTSDGVVNQGTIAVGIAVGIDLQDTGSVTNAATGTIISAGAYAVAIGGFSTVSNLGVISQTFAGTGAGVDLLNGGAVINGQGGGSTASIVGYNGVAITASAASTGTVTNYGSIIGTGGIGVSITSGGAVVDNGPSGSANALIQGNYFGVYVTGGGTVANYGTIIATGTSHGDQGVYLEGTGNISNLGASSLIEGFYGILVHGLSVITNAGTIASNQGAGGVAVQFNDVDGRVVVDPGAVFIGSVNGGEISHAVVELASGSSAGTLSGFGTEIFNFYTLAFDPSARWTAIGNTAAFTTMTTTGFGFGDTIDLTGVAVVSETFAGNALVLTDGSNAHTTLALPGPFSTGNFVITPDGSGGTDISLTAPDLVYAQTVDETGIVAASETVSSGIMTLFNAGSTAVASVLVGTSLSTGDFQLVSDGAGGTDVVVHTAFGTYANGLTLLVNPTTIGSAASIAGTSASAVGVAGPLGTAWTLTNLGTVSETGTGSIGVSLAAAGTVTNATGGSIAGQYVGISLAGGGYVNALTGSTISAGVGVSVGGAVATVVNAGLIVGNTTYGAGVSLAGGGAVTNQSGGTITGLDGVHAYLQAATVVNAGSIGGDPGVGAGVKLDGGGSITNQVGGTITGAYGVYTLGGATVENAGTIGGTTAVSLGSGSTNRLIDDPGARFTGRVDGGNTIGGGFASTLELGSAAGAGTLSGLGSQFVDFAQMTIDAGAVWTLSGTNAVAAGMTLTNSGSLAAVGTLTNSGSLTGNQINLTGAFLTNQASGMVTATIYGMSAPNTVVNQGTISGGGGVTLGDGGVVVNGQSGVSSASIAGYFGVYIATTSASQAGTVTNYGSISGMGAAAIFVASGGEVIDNGPSGNTRALIQGNYNGVYFNGGTILNAGTILATNSGRGLGIYLHGGTSTVTNLGSASLIEGFNGLLLDGVGVVTNAGTIASSQGAVGVAVQFNGSGRLVVDPGAVFIGSVNAGESGDGVLELASGSSAGTLSGIGGSVFNFATLAFDAGASWTAIGNAGGLTTMTTTGFAFGDTIDLTGVAAVSRMFANNALVLTDGSNAQTTLAIQGTFSTGNFHLAADGNGGTDISLVPDLLYAQTVDETGIIAASETVTAGVMTLFNAGATAVGTVAVGTTVSTGDFRLVSDGAGGTDIVVHTAFGTYANGLTLLVNPTTIGSLASVSGTSANAVGVAGPLGTNWTLTNLGTVSESGTASIGVSFASAGTITNATGGIIAAGEQAGSDVGVSLAAGGYVNSQSGGTITGSIAIQVSGAAATIKNAGSIAGSDFFGAGITLGAGGSVTNLAGGTISGNYGVSAISVAATVVNAGYVVAAGSLLPTRTGIALKAGGVVTNQSQGTIAGSEGIYFGGAAGTLINAGSISGGLLAKAGGSVTNNASGIIAGYFGVDALTSAFTAVNAGTISATSIFGAGISLGAGGSITNQSAGIIEGNYHGVEVAAGATIVNAGIIQGITAVSFAGGAANRLIVNPGALFTGTVDGGNSIGNTLDSFVSTLELTAGSGTLTGLGTQFVNFAQTTIDAGANWAFSGSDSIVAGSTVTVSGSLRGTGTLTNSGTIDNIGGNLASHYGVLLTSGGIFTNLGSASLTEGRVGLGLSTNDTVSNFGTIASTQGTTGVAIKFSTGDTLIDNPGAVFTGSIQATGSSVLELASGSTAGTISGLGTSVTNFGTVLFNPGADWTVVGNGGSSGLGGGIPIEGFAVGDTIDLTGFAAVSRSFASNALTLNNGSVMQTLDIQGSLTTNNFLIAPDGSGGTDITLQNLVPPVITGTSAGQTVGDNATHRPFSAVTISDANVGPQSETVTITLTAANVATDTDGTLSGSGLTKTGTGTYTLTAASPAAATTALEALVFTPTPHQVVPGNAVTTGFTLAVTDLDAESATDSTTTVLATAVNDPPVITGTVAGQTETDAATIRPFSGVTIADPDLGASETVSISLKDGGIATDSDGVLAGSGLTKTGTGTYTLAAGTPSAVTAALRTLVFMPVAHIVAPGQTVTTAMALSVSDGIVSTPTTDTTTSVITTDLVPCFAAGTRIATPRGSVPVERLREGDILLTLSGRPRAIQWIGTRTVDCRRHAHPERVKPIRIAAHAFGENRPARPLFLSPDHAVFVEDVLIPVKHLVNDTTITQVNVRSVTYYHVELPSHDVVLAEGLPTESYLETGGRNAFENGGGAMQLHPDFAPDEARVAMVWQNFGYAPLIGSNGELERVQTRLASQAIMLGCRPGEAKRRAGRR